MESSVLSTRQQIALLLSVFIVSFCALVYELLIGSVASYFLGDSVTQFSMTIGFFMSGMGVGAWVSRYVENALLRVFVTIEIVIGFTGGLCVPLLYAAFSYTNHFQMVAIAFSLLIGALIGFEIPLLTRILGDSQKQHINFSNVLSLDYLGGLVATLAFPFFLLPMFGTFNTALIIGLVNVAVGLITALWFRCQRGFAIPTFAVLSLVCLTLTITYSSFLLQYWNDTVYRQRVVYSHQSRFQHIVLTAKNNMFNLYLDGNLQFSSVDEYRYHEALALIPAELAGRRKNILLLGGGDGLAVKQLLKYPDIGQITLVDIDPAITDLARQHRILKQLNGNALNDPRVNVVNADAFHFLLKTSRQFDIIIVDLPDPNNLAISKLYSKQFYRIIANHLHPQGVFLTQATNAISSRLAFWCIAETVRSAGFKHVRPFHLHVPSFGEWGFVMASKQPFRKITSFQVETRFLSAAIVPGLFDFAKDVQLAMADDIQPSTLDRPQVMTYYLKGWRHWN